MTDCRRSPLLLSVQKSKPCLCMRIRPCPPVWSGTQPAWPDLVIRFAHRSTRLRRLSGTAADQWQSLAWMASGTCLMHSKRRPGGGEYQVHSSTSGKSGHFLTSQLSPRREVPHGVCCRRFAGTAVRTIGLRSVRKYVGDRRASLPMPTLRSGDVCRSGGANATRRRESTREASCWFLAGV